MSPQTAILLTVLTAIFLLVSRLIARFFLRKYSVGRHATQSRIAIDIVLLTTLLGGMAWFPYSDTVESDIAGVKLRHLCNSAGEWVYESAKDVEGFWLLLPTDETARLSPFHTSDILPYTYLNKPYGYYETFEFSRSAGGQVYEYKKKEGSENLSNISASDALQKENASSAYLVTWNALTTIDDQRYGVYGDETQVVDRANGKVMGRRVSYYTSQKLPSGGALTVKRCDQEGSEYQGGFGIPFPNSYDFISKVLVPKARERKEATPIDTGNRYRAEKSRRIPTLPPRPTLLNEKRTSPKDEECEVWALVGASKVCMEKR